MTQRGYNTLRANIQELENKVRKIQSQVGVVTTQSSETWHDNAPYSVLVEDLNVADRRLTNAIRDMDGARIREYPVKLEKKVVCYGTEVRFDMDNEEQIFSIVGYGDTDLDKNKILYITPLAKALIGKKEGEKFSEKIVDRVSNFYIKEIKALGNLE